MSASMAVDIKEQARLEVQGKEIAIARWCDRIQHLEYGIRCESNPWELEKLKAELDRAHRWPLTLRAEIEKLKAEFGL